MSCSGKYDLYCSLSPLLEDIALNCLWLHCLDKQAFLGNCAVLALTVCYSCYWRDAGHDCMAQGLDLLQGPLMELSHQRLLFECASGTSASAVLTITNTGSTALYYRWEQAAPQPHQPMSMQFHLSDQNGAVLPGALHTFW